MQLHEGGERSAAEGRQPRLRTRARVSRGGHPPTCTPPAGSHTVVEPRGPRDQTQLARQLAPFFLSIGSSLAFPRSSPGDVSLLLLAWSGVLSYGRLEMLLNSPGPTYSWTSADMGADTPATNIIHSLFFHMVSFSHSLFLRRHSSSEAPGAYVQARKSSFSHPTISGEVSGLRAIAHALYLGHRVNVSHTFHVFTHISFSLRQSFRTLENVKTYITEA